MTVRSGAISTSWKTVAKPFAWKAAGLRPAKGDAVDADLPAVGRDDAGEELDQRALARAVLAHDRVHGAGGKAHRRVVERDRLAVALGEVGDLEHRALV